MKEIDTTSIQDVILAFIREELIQDPDVEIEAEDDLLSGGHISSMAAMRIVAFIEERLDVTVPDEDLLIDNFISVQAMAHYVEGRRAGG